MPRTPTGKPRGYAPRGDGPSDQRITVRATASEYLRIERAAEAAGLPVASWCLRACLAAAPSILDDPDAIRAALAVYGVQAE